MSEDALQRLGPEIQQAFVSPIEDPIEYKDKFPEDLPTLADVKAELGVVVWCKYEACQHNKRIQDLQRTSGSLLKNKTYKPISEREHTWRNVCGRDEIALNYNEWVARDGQKRKVPACFVSAVKGVSGHVDFSRLLQSDGTPYGGLMGSQHVSDAGYGVFDA